MRGHECYHCKQWVEEGQPHDCWTTTEAALMQDPTEDLRQAWERLREKGGLLGRTEDLRFPSFDHILALIITKGRTLEIPGRRTPELRSVQG
jgi:hypothetical protein